MIIPLNSAESEDSVLRKLLEPRVPQDVFVLYYVKLLQMRIPDHTLTLAGPTEITIKSPDGTETSTFVDNLLLQVKRAEDPQELVRRYLGVAATLGDPSPTIESHQIVPLIKASTYFETNPGKLIFEHLAADLWIVFAVDLPDRTMTLSEEGLARLNLDRASLRATAIENLGSILPQVECRAEGAFFLIAAGGDYEASILLLDGVWDQLAGMVEGEIVVSAPARDTLIFTGANSKEGLAAIRDQAKYVVETGDHVISETLLRRRDGKWLAFD